MKKSYVRVYEVYYSPTTDRWYFGTKAAAKKHIKDCVAQAVEEDELCGEDIQAEKDEYYLETIKVQLPLDF